MPKDKIFSYIVISSIAVVTADILSVIVNGLNGPVFVILNFILNTVLMCIDILPSLFWLMYVCLQIYQDVRWVRKMTIPLTVAFVVNAVFIVSNIITGQVFWIDAFAGFVRGPYYAIHVGYVMLYTIIAAVFTIANKKRIDKALFIGLICFMIPVTLGAVLQSFYQGAALTWLGLSISVLSVYFNIQNKHLTTDYLTGVYNRRQLDHYITQKIRRSAKRPFGAILIDLDGFKATNDLYGHHTGDRLLQTAVSLISVCIGKEDFIARYGGDEFCVVLDMDTPQRLQQVAECIQNKIKAYNQNYEKSMHIGMSMGYDVYDESMGKSAQAFLEHIDRLMYQSKKSK